MGAWNPSDTGHTSGFNPITLSSTNHIATSGGLHCGVRGDINHVSGKWYLEYTGIVAVSTSFILGFGFASVNLNNGNSSAVDTVGATDVGNLQVDFSALTDVTLGTVAGQTLSFAVDLGANKLWARINGGAWVGSASGGDPAAGTLGLDISGRSTTALFPIWLLNDGSNGGNGGSSTVTINMGDSSFLESVPAGYAGWNAPPPGPLKRRPLVIF